MAIRTTDTAVRELISTKSDLAMEPFIATGSNLTDWLTSKDASGELSAATLELIERWLAAHFYEHHHSHWQEKETGDARAVFQGKTGFMLLSSRWGQTACLLDVTGRLAQRSKEAQDGRRRTVGLTWLGTAKDSPDN